MKIGVLVPVLSDKDAVGADALEMAAALERIGHNVRVFAQTTIGDVGKTYKPASLGEFVSAPDDLAIFHFSFGWPHSLPLLRALRCRRIIRYHNITPPKFFEGYSAEYVVACESGRAEIKQLSELDCELYLGDSPFNVDDFLEAGVASTQTAVLAPFHRIDRLLHAHADLALLDRYRDASTTWLCVGRLAPNKGHIALVEAFAAYRRAYDASARLLIVGREDARLATYTAAVRARIDELGIADAVHFLNDANDGELKAAYLVADVLVTFSEHEGFCVPLTEAMALGTPIVGYAAGAVASTTGNAGLIWDERDPYLYAASVARIRSDADLRQLLRERGFARMQQAFSTDALLRTLGGIMERFS